MVFHYRGGSTRYTYTFAEAQEACTAISASIATPEQLYAAYLGGLLWFFLVSFFSVLLQGNLFKQIVLTIYICGNIIFLVAFLAAINQV